MYDESLAATGLGAIAIGSVVLNQWWVAAIGAGLVVIGTIALRLSQRRPKKGHEDA